MKIISISVTLFFMITTIVTPSYARVLEYLPEKFLILNCFEEDKKIELEVYNFLNRLILGFKDEIGNTGDLTVFREDEGFVATEGGRYDLLLQKTDDNHYEFAFGWTDYVPKYNFIEPTTLNCTENQ